MKMLILILALASFKPFFSKAQLNDNKPEKIDLNRTILCQTTFSSLKQTNSSLSTVSVEEMDLPQDCAGQDSRYIAGSGFSIKKQPGVIFQKDPNSDFITKIRLNKQFNGMLPDGRFIDLSNLLLRDLFKLYPSFKDNWGSRGCSSYWKFSNDTIAFYVKINPLKQPQFPIDKAYYLDKTVEAVDLLISCDNKREEPFNIKGSDPIFFIDSIRVAKSALQIYKPNEIASITVLKDSNAIAIVGPEGRNGLIYIETIKYAKNRYWNYFRTKSAEYAKLIQSADADTSAQYFLNKRILTKNFEGDLASIDDQVFKEIQIITKQQLKKKYGIHNKEFGVIIISDVPKNLHK